MQNVHSSSSPDKRLICKNYLPLALNLMSMITSSPIQDNHLHSDTILTSAQGSNWPISSEYSMAIPLEIENQMFSDVFKGIKKEKDWEEKD